MKLTEYDENQRAVINPDDVVEHIEECPRTVITCFAHDLIEYAVRVYECELVTRLYSANGAIPLYKTNVNGQTIGVIMSMAGAPAVVSQYEELFALGVENIVVFGTCGVLVNTIDDCSIIIPDCALRDEGTSFHYAPVSDEIKVNQKSFETIIDFFKTERLKYTVGKVWTTDGIYRETRDKVERRKAEGCICVDMECSAVSALAQFRDKNITQFFYAADNLDNENWEERSLKNDKNFDVKTKILKLAMGLAVITARNNAKGDS